MRSPFFEEIVRASGLNEVVAPFTISRLLVRADVQPDTVDPDGLARALPAMEDGLGVYLSDDELEAALDRLRGLAGVA